MADHSHQLPGAEDRPEATRMGPAYTPPADIYETKDALVILVEMPGIAPDAIDVTVEKGVLTISGRDEGTAPEGYALAHAEYRPGGYERAFTLSEDVDSGGIAASMKDGVLHLSLPKAKPAPAKTISVKAG